MNTAHVITLGLMLFMPAPDPPTYPPNPTEPDLFITVYDWSLGGINCNEDCSHTALVPTGPELYGWTAACPTEWLGHIWTTVVTIHGKDFWCIDSFGRPIDRSLRRLYGRWVYRIDVAYNPANAYPWQNYNVPFPEYSVRTEQMSDFRKMREIAIINLRETHTE